MILGSAINYMVRITTNIAIVDMINSNFRKSANRSLLESECIANVSFGNENTTSSFHEIKVIKKLSVEKLLFDAVEVGYENYIEWNRVFQKLFQLDYPQDGFEWNEHEIGQILGSYFWLYWLSQLPGGILASKYGTKLVFGLSNLLGCLMCSLMPLAAYFDYRLLILLRVLQGFIGGFSWPCKYYKKDTLED